jgi:hypothetical protein
MPDTKYLSKRNELEKVLEHLTDYVYEEYVIAAFVKSTQDRIKSALKNSQLTPTHTLNGPCQNLFCTPSQTGPLAQRIFHITLYNISLIHKLKDIDHSNCNDFFLTTTLKGDENLELYENLHKKGKPTITIQLLRNVGHEISESELSKLDEQVFWTTSKFVFWGSLRMGEVLAKKTTETNMETLTWNNIEDDSCLIHIKFPKVSKKGGDYVQIFKVDGIEMLSR